MNAQQQTTNELLENARIKANLPKAVPTFLQKNLQSPPRLYMPMPDSSGIVNNDMQFVADRLAILNHMSAYSYLLDERHMEGWYDLFTDDVETQWTIPAVGTAFVHGMKHWRAFCDSRFRGAGSLDAVWLRRHIQSNVHIVNQTESTCEARIYMTISETWPGEPIRMDSSGTYGVNLVKRNGVWKINRFYIEADSNLPMRGILESAKLGYVTWIPIAPEKIIFVAEDS